MEKHTKGNEEMPNFDKLNDRIIAEASDSPKIQIKTNLDAKSVEEENPYAGDTSSLTDEEQRKFNTFFHDND